MKIFYIIKLMLAAAVSIFFFCANIVYSAEPVKKQDRLILEDGVGSYPVLKNLFDDGFFAADNLSAVYMPLAEKETSSGNDFLLKSALKTSEKEQISAFSMALTDSLGRAIAMEWETPSDSGTLQETSLRRMISLGQGIRKSTVTEAMTETEGIPEMVSEMNVWYSGSGNETAVGGYNVTFNRGFSSTHRFVRTFVEITLLNSIGVANYWINKDDNMEDWLYKYRWKDVGPRFLDGWSYDQNAFRTNTLYHFYAGAVYYQAARSNEYGFLASTAWSFFGGLFWEYIGEWREQTSANDMVFTPFGGSLMGEAFYQASVYIENSMPKSPYGKIFACLLDPMRFINRGLDLCFNDSFRVRIVFVNPAVQTLMDIKNRNR
ncbi:MAG: DUF3943 domain-containing protein [Spirochaetes bacterium]|jgi:hypothetical protein|nr:DUF3943 domain-containing protein [Spirochaetota bacterium]